MRAPEPRGQKSVDARESAKRLAARTLNTPDLFATCVKQSATSTQLILRSFVITNRGQENSVFDTGPVPSSSPTNCSIGTPEARESRAAWRRRPTRTALGTARGRALAHCGAADKACSIMCRARFNSTTAKTTFLTMRRKFRDSRHLSNRISEKYFDHYQVLMS